MKYSINWLKNQIETGIQPDYLFFWGHTPQVANRVDKSCFSQWFPAAFIVEGKRYKTAEHWMMAKKALLFGDQEIAEKIMAAEKPAIAKQLGREVKNFDAVVWEEKAFSIVVEGNQHKFMQNGLLKEYLLQTGNKIIVEASPADKVWGIGLARDAEDAGNPFEWKGTNLLGFALMQVREKIK